MFRALDCSTRTDCEIERSNAVGAPVDRSARRRHDTGHRRVRNEHGRHAARHGARRTHRDRARQVGASASDTISMRGASRCMMPNAVM